MTYDGKGHVTGFSTSKLPSNPNTDASCTETGHYTPATESTTNKQSAGSGKYISGIKLDSKKHVVGIDTGTLPSFTESYKGTVTSITPGTGLTGTSSDTAITSSGTINLKTASSSEIGGIKIGYSESGKNYPVQLDSDYKAYVYVPWTDNTDTKNTAGSSNKTGSKLLLVGATSTTTGTTYTNSNCYVGKDNCLYSGGTKVLTSHQDISGKAPNNHASTAKTYGVATSGTSAKYGHVKLVSGNVNGQTYADGVAAAAAHSHSNYLTSHQDISGKQDKLTSGENIKTINGTSILGKGDIEISGYDDTEIKANLEQAGILAYEAAMRSSRNEQNKADKSSLSTVATSGSYNDLTNKPFIPAAYKGNYSTSALTASSTSFTLSPNTYYTITPSSASTRTFSFGSATSGIVNEYIVEINMSSYAPTIAFPSSVVWANGTAPEYAKGKKYIISIVNNYAVFAEF